MQIATRQRRTTSKCLSSARAARAVQLMIIGCIVQAPAFADEPKEGFCTATANEMLQSCRSGVQDDYHKGRADCINVREAAERKTCFADNEKTRTEGVELCAGQFAGRTAACKLLGEGRYDPEVEPADFDADFVRAAHANPFYPIKVGYRWEYRGGEEINVVEVLNQTKLIDELTCVVVRDRVFKDKRLAEDTDDWFAQARNGDVFYCGEEVKNYETFAGDRPRKPELVSIDGSFKHDRNGDKGGILFPGRPQKGAAFLQEFSLGNAEDVVEILSTSYKLGADRTLDQNVPSALVALLCPGDCVVTKEYSLLEPGQFALKYYARGIGVFLEVKPDTGETVQLTHCNVDPRCALLPPMK
ncbi:MAG TPA: hypothetical protein VFB54_07150 [Burkholderiales bacterium]|nr:hypothetical protein [Burkholderiales bacterium]